MTAAEHYLGCLFYALKGAVQGLRLVDVCARGLAALEEAGAAYEEVRYERGALRIQGEGIPLLSTGALPPWYIRVEAETIGPLLFNLRRLPPSPLTRRAPSRYVRPSVV